MMPNSLSLLLLSHFSLPCITEFQMPLLLISPKVVTPVSTHIFNSSLHVVKELKENIGSLHKLTDITWLVLRPY